TGGGVERAQVAAAENYVATVTDSSGRFVLPRLALGTQSIYVRALGYLPRRLVVDIVDGGSEPERIVLQRPPTTLRAVTVRAVRSYAGFEVRRTSGVGLFLDEAAIQRRNPLIFADIMRSLPGVGVLPVKSFSAKFYTRLGIKECEPSVWVDGVEVLSRTQDLDAYVDVSNVRAVEVYSSPAEVPAGFAGDPFCGAVLIWTRRPSK
ncbi:carboxypeptidase regulatory-like domain-containing protein, partial [Gemmatimonas sp.]